MRILATFVLTLLLAVMPAQAQQFTLPAPEVLLPADTLLPTIPADWDTVVGPFVRVHGAPEDANTLLRLSRQAEADVLELAEALQVPVGGQIDLYLADSEARFRALQPSRAPMWADGVAYPELGLIILKSPKIRGGAANPLEKVLRHELVHVLLGKAFLPTRPPTWLQEGLAQVYAGEVGPQTTQTLAGGFATGNVLSFRGLDRGFPSDPIDARVAYAQSADLIGWLRDEYGQAAIAVLIHELSTGAEIDGALHDATGDFIENLDQRWRSDLQSSGLSFGVLANVDAMFGAGALLLVVGGIARRRQFHRRLEEMGAEEAALDALIADYLASQRAAS